MVAIWSVNIIPIQMGQLFDYGILLLQMCWIVQDAGIQIIDLPLMLMISVPKGQDALAVAFPCKLGLQVVSW